nr:Bm1155 [Brugia malayi]
MMLSKNLIIETTETGNKVDLNYLEECESQSMLKPTNLRQINLS